MSSNILPLLHTPNSFDQSQLWICRTLWCNQPPVGTTFSIAITSRMLPLHWLCGQIFVWVQPHTFLSPDTTVTSRDYFTITHTAALPIKWDMTNVTLNCTSGNLDLRFIRLCIKCRSHCNTRVHLSPKSPENNADEARCRTGMSAGTALSDDWPGMRWGWNSSCWSASTLSLWWTSFSCSSSWCLEQTILFWTAAGPTVSI